jgi:Na+-driven multidrug efflux pump
MGTATSTFVGQNLGNRDLARAKKGLLTANLMIVSITAFLGLPLFFFAPTLIAFFNDKPEVVEFGATILRLMVCFYPFFGISTVCSSAIRGSGNSRTPLIIILSSYVGFRQIYMFIISYYVSNTVMPLTFAMPISWVIAATASLIYLKKVGLKKSGIVEPSGA